MTIASVLTFVTFEFFNPALFIKILSMNFFQNSFRILLQRKKDVDDKFTIKD